MRKKHCVNPPDPSRNGEAFLGWRKKNLMYLSGAKTQHPNIMRSFSNIRYRCFVNVYNFFLHVTRSQFRGRGILPPMG